MKDKIIDICFISAIIIFYIGASIMNTELVKGALIMSAGLLFVAPALYEGYKINKEMK